MAELSTLARPYAKAAFDYAKEQNAIASWETFLSVASDIVGNEDFASLLHNPAIGAAQKADILIDAYGKLTAEQSPAQANFTKQLAEHDRLALLPEIYAHYGKLKSKELKQIDAYVTSAYPLTETQSKQLQERLAISTGSIVILHESVDPSLLGGATIKVGDKFTDGSVRGKLKQLKAQLTA
ncbi:ATP synthase F1 subcomplex delta subunit [Moraxella cuniculi DSM 21768]|uniref:ATP synthase subunit delta n=2 Tax=Moraxella cuniculi TaxID=34061 RepID=A0A1N7F5R6_9GAMM|nr:F0F1 ATP synthase subunit delta [Moraxella cuniculi]OOS06462.1 F0F1 ATP synthase subunit delta [Moraxella cuniculi]SIR95717.1 ATP synthase F1 subcomplex delta subunit [Moraxella cuniculi DSM 21768]VEG12135.1 F-type ATPase subunit delta [Moraxella cuniculi]